METLWRRAVEKEDALAFIAMAVLSCHTSKMSGEVIQKISNSRGSVVRYDDKSGGNQA